MLPAPEPIVMDGDDPRAYRLVRGPYTALEHKRAAQRAERDRRGIDTLVRIAQSTSPDDGLDELRDLVRTAIAAGVVGR
ncbi:hypothetical protein AB0I72_21430 [Nocardiopsis sp. NPDC049922]|uniref:hypothetical protein n=1 Tax=Nocardiopsis sp. NPDC049922 TaxID=3155157 RepID=UPI0034029130